MNLGAGKHIQTIAIYTGEIERHCLSSQIQVSGLELLSLGDLPCA